MPFSAAEFLAVFVRYNEAVWPLQLLLNAMALAVLVALLWRPPGSRLMAALLAVLWGWMAVGYHFLFFSRINPMAWGFGLLFLAGAFAFLWLGVLRGRLRFGPAGGVRGWLGGVLVVFALLGYPLLGASLGQRYPALPTFGLPCPTTIFTLGVLLFAAPPVPRTAFAVPLLWSAIGSVAAFQLGVVQDYGLLAAGLLALGVLLWPAGQRTGHNGMRSGT